MDLAFIKSQAISRFLHRDSFGQVNNGVFWPAIKQIFYLPDVLKTYSAGIPLDTSYGAPDFKA